MQQHFTRILSLEEPFDGPYYQERSAWPALERIRVPAYFGTNWRCTDLHLRGALQAYGSAGDPRRRVVGDGPKAGFGGFERLDEPALDMLRFYRLTP